MWLIFLVNMCRLGVTTVLSTDSVRHIMRNFADSSLSPVLFASTYYAGEALPNAESMEPKERVRPCPACVPPVF